MHSTEIEYIQRLIGQPWDRHGLHCWALVAQVQRDLFGREVPLGPDTVPARPKRRELLAVDAASVGWREVSRPVHGAVVRMHRSGGSPQALEHAGVYLALGSGGVLHTDQPHGVVFDTIIELTIRGWVPRFFVPND